MKLAFLIHSLETGGAERAASLLANAFVEAGHEFHFLLLCDDTCPPVFVLDPKVHVHYLGLSTRRKGFFSKLVKLFAIPKVLSQKIEELQADVAIGFMDQANIFLCFAKMPKNISKIVCEQIHPAYSSLVDGSKGRFFSFFARYLREWAYRKADALILLSEKSRHYFSGSLQKKISIIPNPIQKPQAEATSEKLPRPYILGLGRLVPQKDFATLIVAFAQIADEFPEHSLVIGGEGEMRGELEELVQARNLHHRVFLPGILKSPYHALAGAELFVLSSRYEGFPLALGEAMASGKAVLATDCLTGPSDMIESHRSGILFPVGEGAILANHLRDLLLNEQKRADLEREAILRSEAFGISSISKKWEQVIQECKRT